MPPRRSGAVSSGNGIDRMQKSLLGALLIGGALLSPPAFAEGDAAAGKQVFAQCSICHSAKPGENKMGPSLFGVVGRKSGTEAGFSYSDAVKKLDLTWNEETLEKWLANPAAMAPGTKMVFRLNSDKQRDNVIAYLKTLK